MIEVQGIMKSYGKKILFKDLSFKVREGEFLGLFGESGTGKTTLLNILGLLEKPNEGKIIFDGITNPNRREIRFLQREQIGYLFQNFGLMANETVKENLLIALKRCKDNKEKQQLLLIDSLEQVSLVGFLNKKVFELSGGEQQRVALARLILKRPRVIFADEPTGNLDKMNTERVFSILQDFNSMQQCTVVFVTHDQTLLARTEKVLELPR